MKLRSMLFWVTKQQVLLIFNDLLGQLIGLIFKGQESKKKAGCTKMEFMQGRVWLVNSSQQRCASQ